MIRYIISVFVLTFVLSCSKRNDQNNSSNAHDTTVVEDEVITEEHDETLNSDLAQNSSIPEYMDLELQGYGVPNINLEEYHGKVVFLNHWGSWCPPCRREMPSIQSLYNKYGDKIEFVMIATEKRPGAHIPYIEKEGYTFPVYSMNSPASTEIKAKGFPTTVVLDKKGEIRTYEVGAANWNSADVHGFLDQLLAE